MFLKRLLTDMYCKTLKKNLNKVIKKNMKYLLKVER